MNIDKLITYIKEAENIVIFTGAGVSTLSGLQDFRSKDGIYNEKWDYPPEEILSNSFFWNNTSYFYKFYRQKLNSLNYKPNIIHQTIKIIEDMGKLSAVITQNIDGFDKEAGIKNVIELHGSIYRNHCVNCHKSYNAIDIFNSTDIPRCTCGGIIKPDVVLYEEPLDTNNIESTIKKISTCDLLIVCGTSLAVYPAASFINYFKGKHLVLINNTSTLYDSIADLIINDDLGEVFEKINKELTK